MIAAKVRRHCPSETKLLVISKRGSKRGSKSTAEMNHLKFSDLPELLQPGDLLVMNDAATLPASFSGIHEPSGRPTEMRLASSLSADSNHPSRWLAVFFGEGDWRTPTEKRPAPPPLHEGDLIQFDKGLSARVNVISSAKSAEIEFLSPNLWRQLYQAGRVVQYSHLTKDLDLWDAQTILAGPPVALEAPSASFPLNWDLLLNLKRRGIGLAHLTHAAGISSTGDQELDQMLPLPERFWIPAETIHQVNLAKSEGRRIIALGTSVTRALESSAKADGIIQEHSGTTTLIITPDYKHKIVTGIISGFHENGASHLKLLGSFFREPRQLQAAYEAAEAKGYLGHEYGDSCLIS